MSAPNGKVSTLGDSSPDLPHPSSPPRIQSALFLLAHTSGVTTLALRDAEQTQIRRQYWINDPNCSHHVGFVTFNFENYFNDMSIIRWWYLLHVFVPLLLQPAFAQFSFPKDSAELTEKVDCANAAHDHHHIRIRIEQTSTEKKNEKLPSSRKRQTYRGKICFGINRNGTAKVSIRQPIFTCITIVSSSHAWIPYSNSVVSSVCYWMKSEHITVSASVQTCQQPRIKKNRMKFGEQRMLWPPQSEALPKPHTSLYSCICILQFIFLTFCCCRICHCSILSAFPVNSNWQTTLLYMAQQSSEWAQLVFPRCGLVLTTMPPPLLPNKHTHQAAGIQMPGSINQTRETTYACLLNLTAETVV